MPTMRGSQGLAPWAPYQGKLIGLSGSVAPGLTSNVVVASRCQVATITLPTVAQNASSMRTHWATTEGAITNLKCIDANWYIADTFLPAATGNIINFKRYIEYPAGVFHQVLWAAASPLVMASNSTVYTSDVIISSVTGLPLIIPAGAKFWERTAKTSSGSQVVACQEMPASSIALGIDDGNSNSDLSNSGSFSPSSLTTTYGSVAIIGDIAKNNAKTFGLLFDSIGWGQNDIAGVDSKFNSGWIARSVGVNYSYLKIAKKGWSASDLAAIPANVAFANLFAVINVSDAIFGHGINDLRLGRTKAQVLADHQTEYARFGSARKYQTTLTPRSDTTDAYATTVNQTPKTDGNMAALTSTNTDIRALPAGLTGIIDAADFAMSARDSNIWGGPFPPTTDGTHPETPKAVAMAALYIP